MALKRSRDYDAIESRRPARHCAIPYVRCLLLLLLLLLQGTSPTHGVVGLLESSLCSQPDSLPDRRLCYQPGPLLLVLGASASGHCMVSGLHLTSELQDLPPFSCLATQLHISRSAICVVVHFSPAATYAGPCRYCYC